MLVVVLVLVLAAAALLVIALVTSATLWAWLSVGVSVAAALALLLDWTRRRQARVEDEARRAVEPRPAPTVAPPPEEAGDAEPAEEDTDAADLLVVGDLDTEVRVVDERPRYHLADCTWLAGRPTLGLPITEARQLGFTPCAVCSPDSTLAAAKRTAN
ncbi:MAG TPA: hypothetical protein VGG05_27665 [Pseudonocardiaceae bacterium]|jgi:hypothetical protein